MCRYNTGWANRLARCVQNKWNIRKVRPDKYLCRQEYIETKFTRPKTLTRFGFPAHPRSTNEELPLTNKYCDMAKLHEQDRKKDHRIK